uniref:NADH-ubiquinone oxidoreductase chain 5 n=1 Tax=Loxechinus albus TaxID=240836 RepID=A0A126BM85_9ECHO|nr:NADH dehydrogenase subunit 5 [Loxechinus albus]
MVISPSILVSSLTISIMTILTVSIFLFAKSYFFKSNSNSPNKYNILNATLKNSNKLSEIQYSNGPFAMNVLKVLTFLSLISLLISIENDFNSINITLSIWISNTPTNIALNFILDQYFLVFLPVRTRSYLVHHGVFILLHGKSPNKNSNFFVLLTIFLLNIAYSNTSSNSLFLVFLSLSSCSIFISFPLNKLMSHPNSRQEGQALEAVIYNRIGDIGLITFMALSAYNFNSWELTSILALDLTNNHFLPFLLFGLILAAAGKSAQFGLHPWLPAAMEGPTPVSALLHSSTMVVAGVFILVRTGDLFFNSPNTQTIVLLVTRWYNSPICRLNCNCSTRHNEDNSLLYNKTISFNGYCYSDSTTDLSIFSISAPMHFFKAMLFLCSGSIIHSLNDEQDLRKMGGISSLLPVTSACLALGSLALMGTPFLAGFYSKDLILEAASASFVNTLGISLGIVATMLTAVYSFRIVFFCFSSNQSIASLSPIGEENSNLSNALLRLSIGTVVSGWFFSNFIFLAPLLLHFIPDGNEHTTHHNYFWCSITLYRPKIPIFQFCSKNLSLHGHIPMIFRGYYTLSNHHRFICILPVLGFTHTSPSDDKSESGAQGISSSSSFLSKANQESQMGLIKRYISSSIITTIIIATLSFIVLS